MLSSCDKEALLSFLKSECYALEMLSSLQRTNMLFALMFKGLLHETTLWFENVARGPHRGLEFARIPPVVN